ncbi:hypothetical protein B0H14DRAFT_2589511 [Mycena olivaceomarginata]|nr:hypothetical protein B0H14DRAFT_2589511 [Mycena olivaceomarginata]
MTHLKVLTLHSCYLEASGSAPLPITQPVLISIDLLELRHCRLMLDLLRWAAAVPMALKTVEIESDDQQYLTYILDNKLDEETGSFPRLQGLLIFPSVHLEIEVWVNTGDELEVMMQDLGLSLSSIFQPSKYISRLHLDIRLHLPLDADEGNVRWEILDRVVEAGSIASSMKIQGRDLDAERERLGYVFSG